MSNDEYRAEQQAAREVGLRARHEQRLENITDKLVQQAYDEMLHRILANLDCRVREREVWIREADEETEDFWLRLRGRGVPDRHCELAAYKRLYAEITAINSEASA